MDNRIAERRLADRRQDCRRTEARREEDEKRAHVVGVALLAMVHGGFWLGIGLAVGRLLWGA